MSGAPNLAAAFSFARRESREGLRGFRIFALALFLGVAAIASVGSVSAAFKQGLENEKRRLLGGDLEVTAVNQELAPDVMKFLRASGRVSRVVDAQLMAHRADGSRASVVQVKAVDEAYPLIGGAALDPSTEGLRQALALRREGPVFGAVADRGLFDRLGLSVGDEIRIGAAQFRLVATLMEEPDRASANFMLGPRVIVSRDALVATGLLATSAMVNYNARILLAKGDAEAFAAKLKGQFPDGALRVRTAADASQGLSRILKNLSTFMTLIGLGALVIGGVGAANAVGAYMERKTPVIATLKCLGADGRFILSAYLIQVLTIAAAAVAAGLVTGLSAPWIIAATFGRLLPFKAAVGVYPSALSQAAVFGLLAAAAFAYWPLAAAKRASAARLFRSVVEERKQRPARGDLIIIASLAAAFFGLAIALAEDRRFALQFALGGLGVYALLRVIATGVVMLARRFWRPKAPLARLAAANLTRPGAATSSIAVSLGLGLTLLSAVSLIDANLSRNLKTSLPQKAPALFFSDIPYKDVTRFDARLAEVGKGAEFERYLMMRAGVARLNGKKVSEVPGAERSPWVRDNDWGVTSLAEIPPALGSIVGGKVWPKDYAGPPLLALSDWQAKQLSLKPGDTLTLTIAGRAVTARIAATFDQNFDRGGLNFVAIFAPGAIEAAGPTSIGSLRTGDLAVESAVARMLAAEFPDVAVIRARDVIADIEKIVRSVGTIIRTLTGVTLVAGIVVLLGAVAADYARRLKDAMIMRAIGASRGKILAAQAIEYAILGAGPALAAAGLGLAASWQVVKNNMGVDWRADPIVLAAVIGGATATTVLIGLIAALRALGQRPWPILRSE